MNKLIISILVVLMIIVTGCATGNVVKEPTCKSPYIELKAGECCLDQNSNFICDNDEKVAEPVLKEAQKEEPKSAPIKETITFSASDAKAAIIKIYSDSTVFKDNGLKTGKPYNGTTLNYINFYDSNYVTIIEIKDENKFLNNDEDFKRFIYEFEESKRVDRTIPTDEKGRPVGEYKLQDSLNFIEGFDNRLVDYRYWAKVYEFYYGGYTAKQLRTPFGAAYIYIKCAPNIVLMVYPNDIARAGTSWSSLKEADYDAMLDNQLEADRDNAMEEAQLLLKECP